MEKLQIDKIVNIQAYKYNGKLYRQWNGCQILENNSKHIIATLNKTKVIEPNKQKWIIKEPTIWIFSKNFLWNAIISLKKNEPYVYVNLASTPIYEDNTIKYIDYDLDIKVYPRKELNILDKLDFLNNAKKMNYSKKLMNIVYEELKKIIELYYSDEYIFNNKYTLSLLTKKKK